MQLGFGGTVIPHPQRVLGRAMLGDQENLILFRFLKNIRSWNFKCDSWITNHESLIQTLHILSKCYGIILCSISEKCLMSILTAPAFLLKKITKKKTYLGMLVFTSHTPKKNSKFSRGQVAWHFLVPEWNK